MAPALELHQAHRMYRNQGRRDSEFHSPSSRELVLKRQGKGSISSPIPSSVPRRACTWCIQTCQSRQRHDREAPLKKAALPLGCVCKSDTLCHKRGKSSMNSGARAAPSVFLAAAATFVCCCSLASATYTSESSSSFFPSLPSSALAAFLPPSLPPASPRRRRRVLSSSSSPSAFSNSVFARQSAASQRTGSLEMISSMFRWRGGKNEDEEEVLVNIESPSANVRRISSSIVVNRPLSDVWKILTDYNNLSEYVPNLTQSRLVATPPGWEARGKNKEVRLFQEGAQTIVGFNFKASLTMDMEEVVEAEDEKLGQRRIKFRLVDSAMFSDFSGEWRLQCYSRMRTACENEEWTYSTKLFYMVNVKPKGPVPVGALEWRIKEDVPTNLRAVKVASEKLPWDCEQDQAALAALAAGRREQQSRMTVAQDWMSDETLGAYIGDLQGGGGGGADSKGVLRVGVGSGGSLGGREGGRSVNSRAWSPYSYQKGRSETEYGSMLDRLFFR